MITFRTVLVVAFLTTVLFVGVLGAARMQPFSDHVSARFGDCDMPCWRGVQPGATPIEDAVTRFTAVNGSQPSRHPCSGTPVTPCYHYTWRSGAEGLLNTDLEYHPGVYEVITAHAPGFTLGEALLTLDDMNVRFYGAYPGYEADQAFNFQLLFENSRLTLFTAASCPGSFFTLMQTPVKSINVNYPHLNMRYAPDLSFAAIRRMYFQLCMR